MRAQVRAACLVTGINKTTDAVTLTYASCASFPVAVPGGGQKEEFAAERIDKIR